MNFKFLGDIPIPWVKPQSNQDSATHSVQTKAFASLAKQETFGIDPKDPTHSVQTKAFALQAKQETFGIDPKDPTHSVQTKAFALQAKHETFGIDPKDPTLSVQTKAFASQAKQESSGIDRKDPKLSGWPLSFLSLFPWANNAGEKFQRPTTINKALKRHAQNNQNVVGKDNLATPLRFRPYVCKVPWHTGVRAYFSQLFPRYGHYCGPNWSSGKDGGSLVWDKRPIDWLDYCCYCHDIGYDTHDQAKLLKADLAFLECLENRHVMRTKGDPHVAHLYKTMCINGLKSFLIPYRTSLVSLQQSGGTLIQFGWLSNLRWRSWNYQKE
ncbi:unnamed protein product [Trifolium pratense]|uniref:Uncharacterized protein n=1 Tax=Trifolium pratense TaxID=57577 RepID=A0ACB0J3H3_TRIPR|nr:unnamed protein product [Trifolium pratense]